MLKELLTNEQISNHVERAYSVKVKGITKLDWNVHRVDLEDGKSWVARVFPEKDQTAIECLVKLLRHFTVKAFPSSLPKSSSRLRSRRPKMPAPALWSQTSSSLLASARLSSARRIS
jgi:hypothetical protein